MLPRPAVASRPLLPPTLQRAVTASAAARNNGSSSIGNGASSSSSSISMFSRRHVPRVTAAPSAWNQALLALMPSATEPYQLPLLLSNGHVETIFAAKFRTKPHLLYDREILHMPDGGCVCLDTEDLPPEQVSFPCANVKVLLCFFLLGDALSSAVKSMGTRWRQLHCQPWRSPRRRHPCCCSNCRRTHPSSSCCRG